MGQVSKQLGVKLEDATKEMLGHAEHAIRYSIKVGEFLLKGKSELPHGKFHDWAAKHCNIDKRQRQKCMQLAQAVAEKRVDKNAVIKLPSINEAVSSIPKKKKKTPPVVGKSALGGAFEEALEPEHHREPGDESEPCLLYTSPSPRDRTRSRMPSSA